MTNFITQDLINGPNLVSRIDNTPLGIIIWNNNSQITFWSQRAEAIFGWQPEEAINKPVAELNLIYNEDLEVVNDVVKDILKGKKTYNRSINRNNTKSGKVIYCEWYNSALKDETGKVVSILSLVQDISERINSEAALQRGQKQLSLIYNSAIDPMWLIDIEGPNTFRFIDINTTFTTVTGLTKDKVIGKLIEEVLPPSSIPIVQAKYTEAISTGNVIDYVEVAEHPAGKKVGEIRVIPIKDEKDRVTKILGIANDITGKIEAEEELNILNERLRGLAAHLQEAIEEERAEIAREIHDELGQQLTAIKMDIAWVVQKGETKDPIIYKHLTNAMELLDITVNTVRRIAMDLRPSILDDLGLQEAIIWFADEFRKKTGIDCEVIINNKKQKILPSVSIALFRVFQESLTNIKRHAKASKVLVELKITKDVIRLKVIDNGKGFTVKKRSGKTLGLLGMEERISRLNGHFEIKSTAGNGTSVIAELPKAIADKLD